jgi:hypothetical protein
MNVEDRHQWCQRMARLTSLIEESGLTLKVGSDFLEYRRLRSQFTPERPLYPMFDAASSYVDASNAFWVGLFDDRGTLVHTQALRCIDLGQDTLAVHLEKHHMKYVTPGATPEPQGAIFTVSNGADTITGRACYLGEFWLCRDYGELRGTGMTTLLSRLSFELSYEAWRPDYQWALIEAKHAVSGLHARYGYVHAAPGQWLDAGGTVFSDEWLLWMSHDDIQALIRTPVETIPKILDQQAEKRRTIAILPGA